MVVYIVCSVCINSYAGIPGKRKSSSLAGNKLMENLFSFHFRETHTRKKVDYWLPQLFIEATGDSEVDFDPNMATSHAAEDDDNDNDDAESCSCDVSDDSRVIDPRGRRVEAYGGVVGDNEEDGQGDEVNGHQIESGDEHLEKSCVSVESRREPMNEKEKSRLFWEACLAS